jgi:hypothetical protein
MCNYPLETLKIRVLAALEKVDYSLSKSGKIIRLLKKSISLSNSGRFDSDVL